MSFITCDFETAYGDRLGFKTQTNEEYLRDPRFEVIGVSVKVDDSPAEWFSGDMVATGNWLRRFDWGNSALLAHNTLFDGSILAWHFGIVPAFYYDTLSMARAIHGTEVGNSLRQLVEYYGLGQKGDEVVNAYGKFRRDFDEASLARYGEYCKNDTELTFKLFNTLNEIRPIGEDNIIEQFKYLNYCGRPSVFPESEHNLIDMTLRMYIQPVFRVNDALLVERLEEIRAEKKTLLSGLMGLLQVGTEEEVRLKLSSNSKFAVVLEDLGITPPLKRSPRTGKLAFAFAKTDEGFIALQEHPEPVIQQLCAVRLGTKSTIEESRIERFIDIGARNRGFIPIPLRYYGAHTGRWAGMDSVNFQNLPSRDKKKKALKNSVIPPPGYVVINSDSSQIEARILAWLAGQDDLVEQFRSGEDVYSIFASKIFRRPITRADKTERFVGKTGILGLGYGTGSVKLMNTLATTPPGAKLSITQCMDIVRIYRDENSAIPRLWEEAERCLQDIMAWPEGKKSYWLRDMEGVVEVTPEGFRLPNGLYMRYPGLKLEPASLITAPTYTYTSRRGPVKTWGGSVVENIVQALARIVVGEQMIKIHERYPVGLTVHDAAVVVVPENERASAVEWITKVMSTPPDWGKSLPIACETSWGYSYGECLTDEQWKEKE